MARVSANSSKIREVGLPLAALAIWLLCLLAPLHMAAGALRGLADAGVQITTSWSICTTLATGKNDPDNSVPNCAVQSLAKMGLALPTVPASIAVVLRQIGRIDVSVRDRSVHRLQAFRPNQPRAPPSRLA
ncbi:hypothetical protein [Roseibium aggregatum]|uniref:hypothetical protein n=1 Tax=Roseibium aggregatum TaxID=187304 RepID=UPI003A982D16